MKTRLIAATLFALLPSSLAARADVIIIGNNPNTALAVPFGEAGDGTNPSDRYQQVFNTNLFNSAISISSLSFYAQSPGAGGAFNAVTYNVYLSTTSKAVGALDSGNFDANLGGNTTLFATANPTGNAPGTFTLNALSPFLYDPTKGNLLLDIRIPNPKTDASFFGAAFDGQSAYGSTSSTVHNFGSLDTGAGLTVGLNFSVVPEPSSIASAGVALGLVAVVRRLRSVLPWF